MAARVGVLGMQDLSRVAELAGPPASERSQEDRVNREEAAFLLGTTALTVAGLVGAGLIAHNGATQRNLSRADVMVFCETDVLGGDAARCLGLRPRDVRAFLAAHGVLPIATVRGDGGLVWLRSDIDAVRTNFMCDPGHPSPVHELLDQR